MSEELFDEETGEVETISERALSAAKPKPVVPGEHILEALHAAVVDLPVWIKTDKDNDGFKKNGKATKYASLKEILATARPVLLNHGIRIRQGTAKSWLLDEGGGSKGRLVPVYTELIHSESGETERTEVEIPVTVMTPAAMGSAISYGRRYSFLLALSLATDEADDDGEAAKPKTMDGHQDSSDLAAMTREVRSFRDLHKLEDWAREQKKRFNDLSDDEQGILRERKSDHVKKLMEGDGEPPKPKRGKAAE